MLYTTYQTKMRLLIVNSLRTHFIAKRYREIIDWQRFFVAVNQMGDQCNSRKDRFDKADMFEQAIDMYSGGKLEWVDEIGRDNRDIEQGIDIECKSRSYNMFTKSGKPCKTSTYKIKNSLGKQKTITIENPADFYMFTQENASGIISYNEMMPYLEVVGDGIIAKIPHEKITYIITPDEVSEIIIDAIPNAHLNYKNRKRQMQREFLMAIPKSD